jgi:hypothetical protein
MKPTSCVPRLLARGPIASVHQCECSQCRGAGHVMLQVGPVTLRLSPSAAASVSETLAEAVRVIELELAAAPYRARACAEA